jgi:hypothetical protein
VSRYLRDGAVDETLAKALGRLAEALGTTITENRIRMYAKLLDDVPWPDLAVAIGRVASERPSGFFPSVGEIRRFLVASVDDAALMAWSSLDRAADVVGAYTPLRIDDGATAAALERTFGSWGAFCELSEGPEKAMKRQEFLAHYRNVRRCGNLPGKLFDGLVGAPRPELNSAPCGYIDGKFEVKMLLAKELQLLGSHQERYLEE